MSGKVAKRLRQMAREELIERPPERDLVASPKSRTTAINSPNSVRGFYRLLKKANQAAMKSGARVVRNSQ